MSTGCDPWDTAAFPQKAAVIHGAKQPGSPVANVNFPSLDARPHLPSRPSADHHIHAALFRYSSAAGPPHGVLSHAPHTRSRSCTVLSWQQFQPHWGG